MNLYDQSPGIAQAMHGFALWRIEQCAEKLAQADAFLSEWLDYPPSVRASLPNGEALHAAMLDSQARLTRTLERLQRNAYSRCSVELRFVTHHCTDGCNMTGYLLPWVDLSVAEA